MREVAAELKALRLYGMVGAWEEIVAQGTQAAVESSRWLIEHLLEAEQTDRVMRSISYQSRRPSFLCIVIWPVSTSSSRRWIEI